MIYENSLLASYTPDVAAEIDGEHVDLIERFAEITRGWKAVPLRTRLEFEKVVVGLFIKAMEDGLLDEAVEAGRQDAYNLAAVGMFQVLDMITDHDKPDMLKVCMGIAIGAEPRSQVQIAAEFGVERATISKWARRFVEVLHLVPGRGMRRPAAVAAYKRRQARVWQQRFEEQKAQAA